MSHLNELIYKNFKPDPTEVGLRIKEIRLKLGYSMDEFASRIDDKAKSGTVSNWETGKNLPNNKRLNRIAELGNVSLLYLLKGEKSLYDMSEKELYEQLDSKDIGTIFNNTRKNDLKVNFDRIYNEELSDWQLALLNTSLKFILEFKENEQILSLFDSILENSRIVFLKNLYDKDEIHEDYIHSHVLLEDDINYLRELNTIDVEN